jgi:hypothetical protein
MRFLRAAGERALHFRFVWWVCGIEDERQIVAV